MTVSCCIDCYRSHKPIHADVLVADHKPKPPVIAPLMSAIPDSSEVGLHPASESHHSALGHFEKLASSSELQHLLDRFPLLRSQLHGIYIATIQPADEFREQRGYRSHTSILRGRGHVRVTGRGPGRHPWSAEVGLKRALHRLRVARAGLDGASDGVAAFSNLTLELCPITASNL